MRAVEAYRRSRLVDNVTTEDDKVAAVYRLEEVCVTLRSASLDVVREMVEYIMKRLDHRSPLVKQKVLRLIKFAAPKAGPDFKREMQRQASAIRQLVHYKGQIDVLRGDALNKAVRETAQEAVSAVFAEDRPTLAEEGAGKRIQGFGNSPIDRPSEDTAKSIIGGMIGFGSASLIKMVTGVTGQAPDVSGGYMSSSGGGQRFPTTGGLRRSLTEERQRDKDRERYDKYGKDDANEGLRTSGAEEARASTSERDGKSHSSGPPADRKAVITREEKLLETVTTAGGVRLHPTRDALQGFLTDAMKLDPLNLCNALEKKLQAHAWQVRLKAMCVLEALLRQREVNTFGKVAALFEEDVSIVLECLQSPQSSLREKTKKVLDALGVAYKGSDSQEGKTASKTNLILPPPPPPPGGVATVPSAVTPPPPVPVVLPDLLDTDDWNFSGNTDGPSADSSEEARNATDATQGAGMLGEGDWSAGFEDSAAGDGSDPFTGMAVHSSKDSKEESSSTDLFSGMDHEGTRATGNGSATGVERDDENGLFAGLSVSKAEPKAERPAEDALANLMAGLSTSNSGNGGADVNQVNGLPSLMAKPPASSLVGNPSVFPMNMPNVPGFQGARPNIPIPVHASGPFFQQQMMLMNMYAMGMAHPSHPNAIPPRGFMPGTLPLGNLGPNFAQQPVATGFGVGSNFAPNVSSTYADGFDFSGDPVLRNSTPVEPVKEDTKAFDFISDHLSAFRKGT